MSNEKTLIDNQTACQANYDAKKYICGPWLRGTTWGLTTKLPVFRAGAVEASDRARAR